LFTEDLIAINVCQLNEKVSNSHLTGCLPRFSGSVCHSNTWQFPVHP
jgi:hypothetical protein